MLLRCSMKNLLSQLNSLFFPEMITCLPGNENKIYLTFDDGPTPGITNQVLAFLSQFNARATFFCRGDNVMRNKDVYQLIINQGHLTGNHGYAHLHGWYTNTQKYLDDSNKAAEIIKTPIFRPPYGKITPAQYQQLKKHYTLYLWSALSWDFHPWVEPELCLHHTVKKLYPGAILVFHDTLKASKKLFYVLPRLLEAGSKNGLQYCSVPS